MKRRYFLAAIGAISLSIAACSDEKKSDPATSYEKFRERLQNIIGDLRVESVSPHENSVDLRRIGPGWCLSR